MSFRYTVITMAAALAVGGCQNGGIPSLGLNSCELSGISFGTAEGALLGWLLGHNWQSATAGAAAGAGAGYVATKAFAQELGCADRQRLVATTQRAATEPTYHRVAFASTRATNGDMVHGYVMPVGSWHEDSEGRQVRTVREVLTDGHQTQVQTGEVASNDIDTNNPGYVLPR